MQLRENQENFITLMEKVIFVKRVCKEEVNLPKRKMAFKPKKGKAKKVEEPVEEQEEEEEEEDEPTPPASLKTLKQDLQQEQSMPKQTWEVQSVATETQPVIYNNKTGTQLDIMGALVLILNNLEE